MESIFEAGKTTQEQMTPERMIYFVILQVYVYCTRGKGQQLRRLRADSTVDDSPNFDWQNQAVLRCIRNKGGRTLLDAGSSLAFSHSKSNLLLIGDKCIDLRIVDFSVRPDPASCSPTTARRIA